MAAKTKSASKATASATAAVKQPVANLVSAALSSAAPLKKFTAADATALAKRPAMAPAAFTLQAMNFQTTIRNLHSMLLNFLGAQRPQVSLPRTLLGTISQPAVGAAGTPGAPGANLQVDVLVPVDSSGVSSSSVSGAGASAGTTATPTLVSSGLTDSGGDFEIYIPAGVSIPTGSSLTLNIRGSSPAMPVPVTVPAAQIGPLGYVGTLTPSIPVSSIPDAIYNVLQGMVTSTNLDPSPPQVPAGSTPPVTLGEEGGDCARVLENSSSFDRYPYGLFCRFFDPQVVSESPAPTVLNARGDPQAQRTDSAASRNSVSQPISVDEFRSNLVNGNLIIAGTLGLGYVLRCAQRWSFSGLALGDLVYSLPLAPGEQQQVVVTEAQARIAVQEQESVYGAAADQSSQAGDSSTQATFNSAFSQAAQGSSSVHTSSVSAGGTKGGGLLGILGLPSASVGTQGTSGIQNSSMSGLQNFASDATQSVQTYAEQQGSSQRQAQRTSMRLATASESTSVTTKTITNHNHTRALTMQYFEVLRLYDISTVFEGVDLVCLVPLDVIWFLPYGEGARLQDVIPSSDVAQVVQLASQITSILQTQANQFAQIAQQSEAWLGIFLKTALVNFSTQLNLGLVEANSLTSLLSNLAADTGSGISSGIADFAPILVTQITAAISALKTFGSTANAANGTAAQAVMQAAAAAAQALYGLIAGTTNWNSSTVGLTRQAVLQRYSALLDHSDILSGGLPVRYRSGLTRLERFAADPRSAVALDSLAEDIVQISANATVLPFDHVYVSAVTRWGGRIGPVELLPSPPVTIPGQIDSTQAFTTQQNLVNYLVGQRQVGQSGSGTGNPPYLQATIALPRSLSPSDIVGFQITHDFDIFTYSFAAPTDSLLQMLGNQPANWPSWLGGNLLNVFTSPPAAPPPLNWSPQQVAQEVGPPSIWNFQAQLVASQSGGSETYVNPNSTPVELPGGAYPVPAAELSPILKYSDLIAIEAILQHVMRNVVQYSKAVWTSMTPEERVMLLEPFNFSVVGATTSVTVPLLDCVGNQVLGFYGNSMMLPFSIPQQLAQPAETATADGAVSAEIGSGGWGVNTDQLENNLLLLHNLSPPQDVTRVALATHGVLGEAMLGHCPSAEKIDLTRFWNWQDSPSDTAPAIAPVTQPPDALQTLSGVQAPNALSGMLGSLVTNVNAPTPPATGALAQILAQTAPPASVPNLSGLSQLTTLAQGTQQLASQARADALNAQTQLTNTALQQAGQIISASMGLPKTTGTGSGGTGTGGTGTGGTGTGGTGTGGTGTGGTGTGSTGTGSGGTGTGGTGTGGTGTGGAGTGSAGGSNASIVQSLIKAVQDLTAALSAAEGGAGAGGAATGNAGAGGAATGNAGAGGAATGNAGAGGPPTSALVTIYITSPTNGATVKGTVTFAVSVSDSVPVTRVQYFLNGASLGAPVTTGPNYNFPWISTSVNDGNYTLSASLSDPAGNVVNSPAVPFQVSN